jgi:hypothetical protein
MDLKSITDIIRLQYTSVNRLICVFTDHSFGQPPPPPPTPKESLQDLSFLYVSIYSYVCSLIPTRKDRTNIWTTESHPIAIVIFNS